MPTIIAIKIIIHLFQTANPSTELIVQKIESPIKAINAPHKGIKAEDVKISRFSKFSFLKKAQ
jgi:hypothetical protein